MRYRPLTSVPLGSALEIAGNPARVTRDWKSSVSVASAKRSAAALDKVHTRRLADGSPAFSFRGLLAHLATIVRNTMRRKDAGPSEGTFTLTTEPNARQRQALDLTAAIAV